VHFQLFAPTGSDYAVNRYRREAERHYQVVEDHLAGRDFIVGASYTIADMSLWGWIDRAARVMHGAAEPLGAYPNIKRWFASRDARPAVARARAVGTDHAAWLIRIGDGDQFGSGFVSVNPNSKIPVAGCEFQAPQKRLRLIKRARR
jgi:GST-like protein